MAEIVNLRRARKRKTREAEADAAARNRARFGRPAGEKERDRAEERRADRALDGHKIEIDET